jgi:hypothetical protein
MQKEQEALRTNRKKISIKILDGDDEIPNTVFKL